jgi:serine/threonine-protein kinase
MAASSIPVREGELVAGKYRVERILGAGGMGVVVAARHQELDQLVAIKFVRDEVLGNGEAIERFVREARAVARLRSEHVARVLDVGTLESGTPYIVMEFLEGMDAAEALARSGPMPLDLAASLVLQVCEALSEAHAAGVVHRDLKPQNLFLTRTVGGSLKVKVLDFGVSKVGRLAAEGALTRTSAMLGSPLYMAPEQMRSSRDVDARVDVWALGVVLFELLTTRSPFEAESMPELVLRVATERPLPLSRLRPDLPGAVVAVVERCLEKEPSKRFANVAELASALDPFAVPAARVGGHAVRRSSIPAAWGLGAKGESASAGWAPGRAVILVAGCVAVAVAIVAAHFAAREGRGAASPPLAPAPSATAVTLASSPSPPALPPSAVALEPPVETARVLPAVSRDASISPDTASGAVVTPWVARRSFVQRVAEGGIAVSDNDIPALR